MGFAVMALLALQTLTPPPVILPVGPVGPITRPEWPWIDQTYSLRCDVIDGTMRREQFTLTLTDDDGYPEASISGDDQHGFNTNGFVSTGLNPPLPDGNFWLRRIYFDGENGAYIYILQAFEHDVLQSTSFIAHHSAESGGIPRTQQALGFCSPSDNENEANQ